MWGVRVFNDGATAARFRATLCVIPDDSSPQMDHPAMQRIRVDYSVKWKRSRAVESEIFAGDFDDVLFGVSEIPDGSDAENRLRVKAFDGIAEPYIWHSEQLIGEKPEPFAVIELRISSELAQATTLNLKLTPSGVTLLQPV